MKVHAPAVGALGRCSDRVLQEQPPLKRGWLWVYRGLRFTCPFPRAQNIQRIGLHAGAHVLRGWPSPPERGHGGRCSCCDVCVGVRCGHSIGITAGRRRCGGWRVEGRAWHVCQSTTAVPRVGGRHLMQRRRGGARQHTAGAKALRAISILNAGTLMSALPLSAARAFLLCSIVIFVHLWHKLRTFIKCMPVTSNSTSRYPAVRPTTSRPLGLPLTGWQRASSH